VARPTAGPGSLPAETTSFVGRRHELAEARRKLADARLVSLVGPGGVGKTRLAVRIAASLGRGFPGGAWMAELAEVGDPALVSHAVLAGLGLRDQAAAEPLGLLLGYLRDKELLLVLDNCEHLLEAAAELVSELIRAAPGLRVIATSREPLSVAGEHVLPVPPLELPAPDGAEPLAQLSRSEAVVLFVERAAAASGRFELTAANRAAVAGCAAGSTGCRWRLSWRRSGRARWGPGRSTTGSVTGSACSPGAAGRRSRATRRCAPRSSGAMTC
jgi:predicted ATPase